ncbi:ABC transporter permease [Advenella kashmirensis W13003]|uniref:ABC transporter permease n=1 Tax=Advenella kashmirensis W13003 TaxID=1424334 RepID=V8QPJ8_9BURK|nr:iron ABC transporter permease [Advenella kashmirensis]ETF01263.1 ABC transporter permease [Advenella kashmirensis W13003]
MRGAVSARVILLVLGLAWLGLLACSLTLGRYPISLSNLSAILLEPVMHTAAQGNDIEKTVVWTVRMPRILVASLAGGGLAVAGAVLQGVFRNPLVGPHIIGVSTGATVGGALSILLGWGAVGLLASAFGSGMLSLLLVYAVTRTLPRANTLGVVLAGVVLSGFFAALVSLIQYVADSEEKLPVIVYWLMGSFSTATYAKLTLLAGPTLAATALMLILAWRINILSLGDEEARALHVNTGHLRWMLLTAVAIVVSAQVAVSGSIGWVGLVIPHAARLLTGPDHRKLLPVSFMMGAVFMVCVDNVARSLTGSEIPLSILTAIIGAPVFLCLLRRSQSRGWSG